MDDVAGWIWGELCRARGPRPTPNVLARFRSLGAAGVALLTDLQPRLPWNSWGAWQALELLGTCAHRAALVRLVDMLLDSSEDMCRRIEQILRLRHLRAVPVLLEVVDEHPEELAPLLAECGAHDHHPGVRQMIRDLLHRDLELGASCASTFGDPQLVGDIMEALLHYDVRQSGAYGVVEATAAVWALGVDPGPLGRIRLAEASVQARMMRV